MPKAVVELGAAVQILVVEVIAQAYKKSLTK
jgi:chemotaxis response regulator CheB